MKILHKTLQDNCELPKKTFLEHLEDLRKAIGWSLVFYLISALISIPLVPFILSFLRKPLIMAGNEYVEILRFFKVTDGFAIFVYIVAWAGFAFASPFILGAFLWFIFPAFHKSEWRFFLLIICASAIFFVAGVSLAYFWALPVGIKWLLSLNRWLEIEAFIQVEHYLKFVTNGTIAFGLAFQLPVVLVMLGYIGIITSEQLKITRRYAIVIIMMISMILTPPDPFSMLLLAIPLLFIHEICILAVSIAERRHQRG